MISTLTRTCPPQVVVTRAGCPRPAFRFGLYPFVSKRRGPSEIALPLRRSFDAEPLPPTQNVGNSVVYFPPDLVMRREAAGFTGALGGDCSGFQAHQPSAYPRGNKSLWVESATFCWALRFHAPILASRMAARQSRIKRTGEKNLL